MEREIIVFPRDHPLPPDVRGIIMGFYAGLSWVPISIGKPIRELIIGADIFGFLWKMINNPGRREAIIDAVYSQSLDNFMIYIARWHAAEVNIHRQTLSWNRRVFGSCIEYPAVPPDWRADARWAGWSRMIRAGSWQGVMFACRQYFIYKKITYGIPNGDLRKFMHVVLGSETLSRRLSMIENTRAFYELMVEDPAARNYLRTRRITHFDDLKDLPLMDEVNTLMAVLKSVR